MAVNYEVSGIINPVDQGDSNLCWLATTATLLSWKLLSPMDMRATAKHLGPEFEVLLTGGDALPGTYIPRFLQRSKLIALAGQSRPATALEKLLKDHGLLAVGVDADAPNNYMAHLITLYGIAGDGSLDGTRLKIIDPAGGARKTLTFREFGRIYGADDATSIPFNMFYSP